MTNEENVIRSVFSSYINDLKAYSTKPNRPIFKMLEDVRDKAIKALETTCIEDYPTCTECEHYDSEKHYCPRFCQVIKDALAEAQPKKGEWIEVLEHRDEFSSTWHYECSECRGRSYKGFEPLERYCPNCGAEMSGGGEDEVSD